MFQARRELMKDRQCSADSHRGAWLKRDRIVLMNQKPECGDQYSDCAHQKTGMPEDSPPR